MHRSREREGAEASSAAGRQADCERTSFMAMLNFSLRKAAYRSHLFSPSIRGCTNFYQLVFMQHIAAASFMEMTLFSVRC